MLIFFDMDDMKCWVKDSYILYNHVCCGQQQLNQGNIISEEKFNENKIRQLADEKTNIDARACMLLSFEKRLNVMTIRYITNNIIFRDSVMLNINKGFGFGQIYITINMDDGRCGNQLYEM